MDYYGVYKNEGRYNDILDEIEHVYEALKEEKEAPRF
jgi:peroxiredoxin family protein